MSTEVGKGTEASMNHDAFRLVDGWYCLVDGYRFGPWPDKGSCQAGYQTELRRFDKRKLKA
jgi:hypothetical protein